MPLITVVVVLIIVGVLLWVVNTKIPMDATVKTILNVVVILVIAIWILKLFFPELWSIHT